ncbi:MULTISPECIES: Zn(2+)-responsive transcriptional regulator [unclassified Ketobacter]|uniref:Zn(2+)-responsive transcriptional regulator n=1 Tax=unclassified Ketobacter TaxID=2639109 RepID=UPI0025C5495B|nr:MULTISPECIES: Zn(2+)-responsive transcriptional regulator [unclassified Ketobacter]|tara:strand:- start:4797 stop:5258 length:462 start_codon:yes stop_codon:yes gene_type:complete
MKRPLLKIGELANLANVSQDTLRFYEKHGLMRPSARSEAGYRLYSAQDLQRIRFILSAKEVGFTLKEIEELLALEVTRDEKSCQDVKSLVDEKLATVTQRIHELQRIKKSLQSLSDACCGGDEPATHCTILEALSDHDAGSSLVGGKHHDLIK